MASLEVGTGWWIVAWWLWCPTSTAEALDRIPRETKFRYVKIVYRVYKSHKPLNEYQKNSSKKDKIKINLHFDNILTFQGCKIFPGKIQIPEWNLGWWGEKISPSELSNPNISDLPTARQKFMSKTME